MLTPNQFELELLSGRAVASEADAAAACAALHARGPRVVVVTSLDLAADHPDHVAMLASAVDDGGDGGGGGAGAVAVRQWRLLLPKVEAMHFTGTGDLMAALLLAWTHRHPGADGVAIAMEKAGATMQAVLKRTVERSRERGGGGAGAGGGGGADGGGGEGGGGGVGGDPAARRELALLDAKREIEEPTVEVRAVALAYL